MKEKEYKYINVSASDEIKKSVKVFKQHDYHDEFIKNNFHEVDYILEVNNYDNIVKNSVLKNELENIERLKVKFEEINDLTLKEKGYSEIDELEETDNREILNRHLALNLKRRGLKFTNKDNIYFSNKEDLSYNDVKSYYLDVALSHGKNTNFEIISKKLKKTIASKQQSFTFFNTILRIKDNKNSYLVILKDLTFNNEIIKKDIEKLFLPYTSLVIAEVIQLTINESQSWSECGYYVDYFGDSVISLQDTSIY